MEPIRPTLLPYSQHEDLRGAHLKFFGATPETISTPYFTVAEVFATVNKRDALRGLAFQDPPQPKIIQVLSGALLGHAVCSDPELSFFGETMQFSLGAQSGTRLFIPPGWAQGYRALQDDTIVLYLAGAPHDAQGGLGIDPFDPELNLDWGENFSPTMALQLDRDKDLPSFKEMVKSHYGKMNERNNK